MSATSSSSTRSAKYCCVIFDLGGVVLDSPVHVIARYERDLLAKLGRERGDRPTLNKIFASSIHFQRLERGEYQDFSEFARGFDAECMRDWDLPVNSTDIFTEFARGFDAECMRDWDLPVNSTDIFTNINQVEPRKVMVDAIQKLRQNGYRVGSITNNWQPDKQTKETSMDKLDHRSLFEVVIESSLVGVRKPNPKIYRMALDALNIGGLDPTRVVFLDDIGKNLKPAAEMGMKTIKI